MLKIEVSEVSGKPYLYMAQLKDDSMKEMGVGGSVEEAVGNFICLNQDDLDIKVRTD